MKFVRRPSSLREVAEWSLSFADFSMHVRDALHEFSARPAREQIEEEPALLADRFPKGVTADAYLAAMAATLADQHGWPRPAWTRKSERYLREPWFSSPGPHMRACLLIESPSGFRERNLFVTANALEVR